VVLTVGQFYNYPPNGTVAGTYTFTRAPYLTLHSTSTGNVQGTVTSGTYVNQLELNTSYRNFTQVWITSTTNLTANTVTFDCCVGHRSVIATMVGSNYAAGCGNLGLSEGTTPHLAPEYSNATSSLILTDSPNLRVEAYEVLWIISSQTSLACSMAAHFGHDGVLEGAFPGDVPLGVAHPGLVPI
jgi:hypothetical protein